MHKEVYNGVELDIDRRILQWIEEVDEAMNKVKRCSRLCGKSKDGLSYTWHWEIIPAMKKSLELVGYDVRRANE